MNTTRVLLADDHALVRAGIRSLLEKMTGIQVVAEAGDGREALELIKKQLPDVVLMDIAIPELNGLEALARHANEEYVLQALRAVAELELALRAVTRGETYLSPRISKRVIDSYLERLGNERPLREELTPRQREIVQLIAEGKSTKEIAFLLTISVKTVEAHRAQLMERLGIHDVAGLVRYAMRVGLVPPEGPPRGLAGGA
jgi:DNA-binding NarL/FixJ family response regulator